MDPDAVVGQSGTPATLVADTATPPVPVSQGTVSVDDPAARVALGAAPQSPGQPAAPPVDMAEYEELRRFKAETQPRLEEWEARQQQDRIEKAVGQEAAAYQQRLEAVGLPPETAKQFADEHWQVRASFVGLQHRAVEALRGFQSNAEAGLDVLTKRGVLDAEAAGAVRQMLQMALEHRDPVRARQKIDGEFGTRAEVRRLSKELADLKRGQVPPQSYESSGGGGASAPSLDTLLKKDTRQMDGLQLAQYERQMDEALRRGR